MSTVSASVARQTLPAQLDRVEAGEEVAITRHGRVVAVLVHPDTLTARRAPEAWGRANRVADLIEEARTQPLRRPALSRRRADELVEDIRADRSAR